MVVCCCNEDEDELKVGGLELLTRLDSMGRSEFLCICVENFRENLRECFCRGAGGGWGRMRRALWNQGFNSP